MVLKSDHKRNEFTLDSFHSSSLSSSKGDEDKNPPLPNLSEYKRYTHGRNPFYCLSCSKSLTRQSLHSHIKSEHGNLHFRIQCTLCSETFENRPLDVHGHVHNDIYPCHKCKQKNIKTSFSDFERLQAHLKNAHNGYVWPWICGFCDLILFYELDFKIHLESHRESPPYSCPLCSLSYSSNSKLRSHCADKHLGMDEESAVNHEIAALLLNLASRTPVKSTTINSSIISDKPEDLTMFTSRSTYANSNSQSCNNNNNNNKYNSAMLMSNTSTTTTNNISNNANDDDDDDDQIKAIDLSSKSSLCQKFKDSDDTHTSSSSSSSTTSTSSSYPYPFISPNINSTYLLQNLLLGKMAQQQIANVISTSNSTGGAKDLLPTQPLPENSLSLVKQSVQQQQIPKVTEEAGESRDGPHGNIPLLCGQIVAQLNGLLFLVHGLNNSSVENNLQNQLGVIYNRLTEIVSMVDSTKSGESGKDEIDISFSSSPLSSTPPPLHHHDIGKQFDKLKESKIKEEEKIARHIQDYQRALLQQQQQQQSQQQQQQSQVQSAIQNIQSQQQHHIHHQRHPHHQLPSLTLHHSLLKEKRDDVGDSELLEVESSSSRRRRGRPPKNLDLSFSPKRPRSSVESTEVHSSGPKSVGVCGKGSKGIRNRVFCGECPGCLKNDDCGRCRYCQDKTKFGGQNRLRQKCLHRRCQMDNNRKRCSSNQVILPPTSQTADSSTTHRADLPTLTQVKDLKKLSSDSSFDVKPEENEDENEDEDDEDKSTRNKSRIDKWKEKHEAMLKMAEKTEEEKVSSEQGLIINFERKASPSPSCKSTVLSV